METSKADDGALKSYVCVKGSREALHGNEKVLDDDGNVVHGDREKLKGGGGAFKGDREAPNGDGKALNSYGDALEGIITRLSSQMV